MVYSLSFFAALFCVGVNVEETRQTIERRIILLPAERYLLLIESGVIMLRCRGYGVVLRRIALNYDLSSYFASTRPACYLRQKLKSALAGVEIRQVQSDVRIYDAHQSHQRNIEAFDYHLG